MDGYDEVREYHKKFMEERGIDEYDYFRNPKATTEINHKRNHHISIKYDELSYINEHLGMFRDYVPPLPYGDSDPIVITYDR